MDSLPHSAQLIRSLLLSGLLLASSFDAVADQRQNSHQSPSKYTANLDFWGPYPNFLKSSPAEPRWMALQEAERGKINACQVGQMKSSHIYSSMAYEERIHENFAKGNGQPRRPLGEIADEVFRHAVEYEIGNPDGVRSWPYQQGKGVAIMYGYHFGYQFWREYYDHLKVDPFNPYPHDDLHIEQFWYLCLERVPTACFEKGEPDPRHCLSKLIHPREFPAYDVASDLYQKFMERPDTWLVEGNDTP